MRENQQRNSAAFTSGPQLVPARSYIPLRTDYSLLAMWHLLSLDAPTVAALWTFFLARCAGVALPWTSPAAMFLAVWMIYAADRLLDARLLDARLLDACLLDARALESASAGHSALDLEERHRFHHRHRNRFLPMLGLSALAMLWLLPRLSSRALLLYTLLATLLGTWLLIVHARSHHSRSNHRLPKELAVGIFFAAAVFIPTVARAPWLQLQLLPGAALFAAVCTLNCLFLYAWEHPDANTLKRQAHWTTLWAIRHLPQLAIALILLTLPVIAWSSTMRLPALACAASTLLLLSLHAGRHRIRPVNLRAAADAALLTPLLVLPMLLR